MFSMSAHFEPRNSERLSYLNTGTVVERISGGERRAEGDRRKGNRTADTGHGDVKVDELVLVHNWLWK